MWKLTNKIVKLPVGYCDYICMEWNVVVHLPPAPEIESFDQAVDNEPEEPSDNHQPVPELTEFDIEDMSDFINNLLMQDYGISRYEVEGIQRRYKAIALENTGSVSVSL